MKTQIRRGVFETNSSSVHSISIIKDDFKTTQNTDLTEKEKEVYGTQKNRLSDLDAEIDRVITSVMKDAKSKGIDNKFWSKLADHKKEIRSSIDKAFNAIMELELKVK